MKDPKGFAKNKMIKKSDDDDVSTRDSSDKKLSGKIYAHNRKKLHSFAQKRMKKSIDFKETLVSIDSKDQHHAETTTSKALLDYIQKNMSTAASDNPQASQWKIPFPTGILTLTQREPGLFHGFFSDRDGQIIEKFDSQTVAIIAKNLEMKSLVPEAAEATPVPVPNASDIALSAHNRIDDLQRQVIEQQRGKSIRIKYGDFELEIKKSLRDFVTGFKTAQAPDKDVVRKAISSWRKKHAGCIHLTSDQAAARELVSNWDSHQESFCQFIDALSRGDDEQG